MIKNPIYHLVCLYGLFFCLACSSSKKTTQFNEHVSTLPELPMSELDIPIKIPASAVMDKAEKLVPVEFTSVGWPDFMRPSCDFRYKYRFTRSALQISCTNNVIVIHFGGNYQISGSKCLCTAGFPVTPWVSGNCGFLPQPLRKVDMTLTSTLQFLPNYRLRTFTSIRQIQPLDKCEVSVFSSDITQLVMDSIRSSLLQFSVAMDQSIGGLDFGKLLSRIRDSSYRKISIGKYGYFLLDPTSVRLGQLNLIKDSFCLSVGLSCKPELTSEPANRQTIPASLPALLQTESRNGVRLYLNINYDYNFLSKILKDSLYNKVFDVKGRTIVIKEASIRQTENQQLELRINFAGSNHGSIYLRGTPILDTAKQSLSIPNMEYSLEDEDLGLKIAKSLFHNKIRKTIQGKSYLDIAAFLATNRTVIEQLLNRDWIKGVSTSGFLKEAKIIGLAVTPQSIQLQVFINGELNILGGNL